MSANYHPAMKIVKPVRRKLKIKTVFNILGPLLNPARVQPELLPFFFFIECGALFAWLTHVLVN